GLLRLQTALRPQRDRRLVHRLLHPIELARLHADRQLPARPEDGLELRQRDDRELVLRSPEDRAALRAHPDDAEMHALDLDDLLQRIDRLAEQAIGGPPAD